MSGSSETLLRRVNPEEIGRDRRDPVDAGTLQEAARIVDDVRDGGERAARAWAERFGERRGGEPLVLGPPDMRTALEALGPRERGVLERAAERIRSFAEAQRRAVREVDVAIPGGRAGHSVEPVTSAGCYAPCGRYPLPSSALMTA